MPKSPYADPYGDMSGFRVKGPSKREREEAEKRGGAADLMRLLGAAAPVVGGGIGMLAGGPLGAGIGAGIGQLAGSALGYGADQTVRGDEEADMARRRRLEAAQRVAGLL